MIGLIVSSSGCYVNLDNTTRPKINEALPVTELSNVNYDKKVYGVISYLEDIQQSCLQCWCSDLSEKATKNREYM